MSNPGSLLVSEEEKKELRRRSLAHRSRPKSSGLPTPLG